MYSRITQARRFLGSDVAASIFLIALFGSAFYGIIIDITT